MSDDKQLKSSTRRVANDRQDVSRVARPVMVLEGNLQAANMSGVIESTAPITIGAITPRWMSPQCQQRIVYLATMATLDVCDIFERLCNIRVGMATAFPMGSPIYATTMMPLTDSINGIDLHFESATNGAAANVNAVLQRFALNNRGRMTMLYDAVRARLINARRATVSLASSFVHSCVSINRVYTMGRFLRFKWASMWSANGSATPIEVTRNESMQTFPSADEVKRVTRTALLLGVQIHITSQIFIGYCRAEISLATLSDNDKQEFDDFLSMRSAFIIRDAVQAYSLIAAKLYGDDHMDIFKMLACDAVVPDHSASSSSTQPARSPTPNGAAPKSVDDMV